MVVKIDNVCPSCGGSRVIASRRYWSSDSWIEVQCLKCETIFWGHQIRKTDEEILSLSEAISESEAEYHAQKRAEREDERRRMKTTRTTEEQICCLRVVIEQIEDFRYCARNEIDDHIEPLVSILQEIINELEEEVVE